MFLLVLVYTYILCEHSLQTVVIHIVDSVSMSIFYLLERKQLWKCKTGFKPPVKYFTDHSEAMLLLWIPYVISVCFLSSFRAHLFIDALWSPAWKELTSVLSFIMSNCEVVIFALVSLVRCGAWLYQFLIFALFLTSFNIMPVKLTLKGLSSRLINKNDSNNNA